MSTPATPVSRQPPRSTILRKTAALISPKHSSSRHDPATSQTVLSTSLSRREGQTNQKALSTVTCRPAGRPTSRYPTPRHNWQVHCQPPSTTTLSTVSCRLAERTTRDHLVSHHVRIAQCQHPISTPLPPVSSQPPKSTVSSRPAGRTTCTHQSSRHDRLILCQPPTSTALSTVPSQPVERTTRRYLAKHHNQPAQSQLTMPGHSPTISSRQSRSTVLTSGLSRPMLTTLYNSQHMPVYTSGNQLYTGNRSAMMK